MELALNSNPASSVYWLYPRQVILPLESPVCPSVTGLNIDNNTHFLESHESEVMDIEDLAELYTLKSQ